MMARPSESRTRVAIENSTPSAVTAARSIAEGSSEFRRVLRMLVRLGDQVANLFRVGRLDVIDRLEDREALVAVDLGEMHRVHDVMALGIELDRALGSVKGQSALKRGNDLRRFERACLVRR